MPRMQWPYWIVPGSIIFLNRKMLEITGHPDEGGLCGKNFSGVIAGPDHDRFMEYLSHLRSSGTVETQEFAFMRKGWLRFGRRIFAFHGSRRNRWLRNNDCGIPRCV